MKIQLRTKGKNHDAGLLSIQFIRWAKWQRYSRFGVSNA